MPPIGTLFIYLLAALWWLLKQIPKYILWVFMGFSKRGI
jgi:hypothetical protein